jgi:hypothetical protein
MIFGETVEQQGRRQKVFFSLLAIDLPLLVGERSRFATPRQLLQPMACDAVQASRMFENQFLSLQNSAVMDSLVMTRAKNGEDFPSRMVSIARSSRLR